MCTFTRRRVSFRHALQLDQAANWPRSAQSWAVTRVTVTCVDVTVVDYMGAVTLQQYQMSSPCSTSQPCHITTCSCLHYPATSTPCSTSASCSALTITILSCFLWLSATHEVALRYVTVKPLSTSLGGLLMLPIAYLLWANFTLVVPLLKINTPRAAFHLFSCLVLAPPDLWCWWYQLYHRNKNQAVQLTPPYTLASASLTSLPKEPTDATQTDLADQRTRAADSPRGGDGASSRHSALLRAWLAWGFTVMN